jgi:hypothetical protein
VELCEAAKSALILELTRASEEAVIEPPVEPVMIATREESMEDNCEELMEAFEEEPIDADLEALITPEEPPLIVEFTLDPSMRPCVPAKIAD